MSIKWSHMQVIAASKDLVHFTVFARVDTVHSVKQKRYNIHYVTNNFKSIIRDKQKINIINNATWWHSDPVLVSWLHYSCGPCSSLVTAYGICGSASHSRVTTYCLGSRGEWELYILLKPAIWEGAIWCSVCYPFFAWLG